MNKTLLLIGLLTAACSTGCGDPQLHQVTGKVTLGGVPHERLLVYMRPIDEKVDKFRMGVGETDAAGVLTLRSSAGDGLAAGHYRVSFSCMVPKGVGNQEALDPNEKHDDNPKLITEEIVPDPYSSDAESPVEFEIGRSDVNEFVFDIPAK
ncbi:hypothetical protein Enr13x_52510 [Stieleria neptunia]|uniref:Uncharacterized protein n=1 Tax=Stieleria neptunia TaxID=2527979 RepID=A0A518HX87_9BACT|nr:hypothetical protein [Stieleria neptunia]QDV45374.1 hypothetical protein Enr13x_52510 [Stieleria neptunia]